MQRKTLTKFLLVGRVKKSMPFTFRLNLVIFITIFKENS